MKCLCNVRCRLIKDVDMFGKEPELYYNGRQKKNILGWKNIFFFFCISIFWIFPL